MVIIDSARTSTTHLTLYTTLYSSAVVHVRPCGNVAHQLCAELAIKPVHYDYVYEQVAKAIDPHQASFNRPSQSLSLLKAAVTCLY